MCYHYIVAINKIKTFVEMRRTPKLEHVGRAYSEMSPLNPSSSTRSSGASQGRRDSSGYGSIFPFGFFRHSFEKTALQVLLIIFI